MKDGITLPKNSRRSSQVFNFPHRVFHSTVKNKKAFPLSTIFPPLVSENFSRGKRRPHGFPDLFHFSDAPTTPTKPIAILSYHFYSARRGKPPRAQQRKGRNDTMMKLLCSREKLVEAVSNVQRTVSTKSSIPALEGILLRAAGTQLTLCGYDLELGMTTSIEASCTEEGAVVLSARLFGDIGAPPAGRHRADRRGRQEHHLYRERRERILDRRHSRGRIPRSPLDQRSEQRHALPAAAQEHDPADDLRRRGRPTPSRSTPARSSRSAAGKSALSASTATASRSGRKTPVCEEELSFVVPGKTLGEVSKLLR